MPLPKPASGSTNQTGTVSRRSTSLKEDNLDKALVARRRRPQEDAVEEGVAQRKTSQSCSAS